MSVDFESVSNKRIFFVNSEEKDESELQSGFLVIDDNNDGRVDDNDSVIIEKSNFICEPKKELFQSKLPDPKKYTTVSLANFRRDFFKGKLTVRMTDEVGFIDPFQLAQGELSLVPFPPSLKSSKLASRKKIYDILQPIPIKPLVNTGNCPIDEEQEWKGPFSHRHMPVERLMTCPLINSKDARTDYYLMILTVLNLRFQRMSLSKNEQERTIAANLINYVEKGGAAIYLWSTEAYQVINPILRDQAIGKYGITFRDPRLRKMKPAELRKLFTEFYEEMDNALNAIPPYKGTVYRVRKLAPEDVRTFFEKHKVGTVIEEKGYLSTATDPKINVHGAKEESIEVRYEIESISGRNIKYFSKYPTEDEILFMHGTSFKIEEVKEELKSDSNTRVPKTIIRVKMREVIASE